MRVIPLFDTNIFTHARDGTISGRDWQFLLRHRPRKGWPLSAITLLELLVGVHLVSPEKFDQSKRAVVLARELSKGRVLDEPRVLLCENVLHTAFPSKLEPISTSVLRQVIEVTCHANSQEEIVEGRVQYKRSLYGKNRSAGINTGLIEKLMAGPKEMWVRTIEAQLTEIDPDWREHFTETGVRLPEQWSSRLDEAEVWEQFRLRFSESILEWLGARTGGPNPLEFSQKIDAVIRFTSWVVCESLLRYYTYAKHESDVYDEFQLYYLADEKYVIVTNDQKLRHRTLESSQASRILSFDQFVKSL